MFKNISAIKGLDKWEQNKRALNAFLLWKTKEVLREAHYFLDNHPLRKMLRGVSVEGADMKIGRKNYSVNYSVSFSSRSRLSYVCLTVPLPSSVLKH